MVDLNKIRRRIEDLSINKSELKKQLGLKGKSLHDSEIIDYN